VCPFTGTPAFQSLSWINENTHSLIPITYNFIAAS
jgi:hypothetical protein